MKIDAGLMGGLDEVPTKARELEAQGFDGLITAEMSSDPFLPLLLAAEHTERIELMTSIAVAFARSPMILANLGNDLQAYSKGRFILGIGSQIAPHITKRFSMPWSRPAARMREFILAMRAIWDCWYKGEKLAFRGEFYTHTLMTPMFTPTNNPHGAPRVVLAAVGPRMTEVAGEVADGMLVHGFTTERYLREVTLPAVESGLAKAGRPRDATSASGSRPAPPSPASSPSTARRRPTAACSSSTAGGSSRPSSTRCRSAASGWPWASASATRSSRPSRSWRSPRRSRGR
jgi:alkanesulfonate monooxygenase SsuD/methylene tetrahydromethanopterin reductase-like flavin-dependent oxidoreductase (luciferase family)